MSSDGMYIGKKDYTTAQTADWTIGKDLSRLMCMALEWIILCSTQIAWDATFVCQKKLSSKTYDWRMQHRTAVHQVKTQAEVSDAAQICQNSDVELSICSYT